MNVLEAVEKQRSRARLVVWLLAIGVAVNVAAIASGAAQYALLERAATVGISTAEASANDARHGAIGLLQVILLAATGIAWFRWAHRAHANLALVGLRRTDYTPAAAVYSWFVPILNLIRPLQIMKELWLRSRDANTVADLGRQPAPGLVAAWWAAWLVASVLGQFLMRASGSARGIPELENVTVFGAFTDVVHVVGAILAVVIVRRVDQWQRSSAVAAHAVDALS